MLPPSVLHGEEEYKDTFSGSFPHRRCRLFCMGVSAHCRGNCPACTGSSPHDLFDHNVKTAFVEVLCGFNHGVGPPSSHWGSPSTSGKRCARTSPLCGVPHSGRRSDRNPIIGSFRVLLRCVACFGHILTLPLYTVNIFAPPFRISSPAASIESSAGIASPSASLQHAGAL